MDEKISLIICCLLVPTPTNVTLKFSTGKVNVIRSRGVSGNQTMQLPIEFLVHGVMNDVEISYRIK